MHRQFNDVVGIDHSFHDGTCVLHIMAAHTRYSAGYICCTEEIKKAVGGFEEELIRPFWSPKTVHADQDFKKRVFLTN